MMTECLMYRVIQENRNVELFYCDVTIGQWINDFNIKNISLLGRVV